MVEQTDTSRRQGITIAAVVVLYYPHEAIIRRLLGSLADQVDVLYAIDNTPGSEGLWPFGPGQKAFSVTYVPLGKNRGLAEAQNIGIEMCLSGGYSHVLLLDQDSALSPDMVNKVLAAEQTLRKANPKIAAVVPQILDGRTGRRPCAYRYGWLGARKLYRDVDSSTPVQTDFFIASGALIRTAVFRELGMMRSDLLIDHVDTEWALRAHTAGYRSYCVPNATLIHSLGDGSKRILGKDVYLYSEIRYYYRLRNEVYLSKLPTMGWNWRVYIVPMIPYHFVLYSLLSKNRLRVARLLMKAIWDGVNDKLGPSPGF
ncbi:MAG TPA: glycosyltransferase family 2 protein [Terracidiphilus sp.]|nr:glycosyltransferase family 2 protein [Terracidiphilus sp.]